MCIILGIRRNMTLFKRFQMFFTTANSFLQFIKIQDKKLNKEDLCIRRKIVECLLLLSICKVGGRAYNALILYKLNSGNTSHSR